MNDAIRALFPVTEKYVYLNHAAVSPLSTRVREAMTRLVDDVTLNGSVNYDDWLDAYERARHSAARLVNARPSEIAFMRNTSDAISAVSNSIQQLDVERDAVDAFAADAHKYLLGPEGVAVMYVSERVLDQIEPTVVGWTSVKGFEQFAHAALDYQLDYREGALRFECGTLNTVGVSGVGAAVD